MITFTGQNMKQSVLSLAIVASLAACTATSYPPRDTSAYNSINDQLKQAAAVRSGPVAVPSAVSGSLLPPVGRVLPKASKKQMEPRFDLIVKDTPIDQVLSGIVADTRYSLLIKPRSAVPMQPGRAPLTPLLVTDTAVVDELVYRPQRVSIDLRDVTVFEALDTIRDVYGYDYTVEGRRIYVQPPELQTRLYQVNYIIGQRRGVSDLKVIGGASVGASSSSTSGTSGSSSSSGSSGSNSNNSSYSSVQASGLSTYAKSDLWGELQDVVRTTLGCQIPDEAAVSSGSNANSGSTNTAGSSRADVSFVGDAATGQRQRGVDGCTNGRSVMVSPMSGTLLIRGMPNEHRMIEKMIKAMQLTLDRQVIIEAKIMDVELNASSQQGINWAIMKNGMHSFSSGANASNVGVDTATTTRDGGVLTGSLGDLLGAGLATAASGIAAGAGVIALQNADFSAMVKFLQTQGSVHVLSSPRISTLNNQKAVIKVGSEEPYVTNIEGGTASTSAGVTVNTQPTLRYQPFFAGIALDVTPQIDDRDNISLHVHSMVNNIVEKEKPALPTNNAAKVPFAVNTVSETDTVVKSHDGQVIVIGGLMTESAEDTRSKTPGVGDVPVLGAMFRQGAQAAKKRELVILLKTTIVKDDSAWSNDINGASNRVSRLSPDGEGRGDGQ